MEYGSETLASLIRLFAKMPGIGFKTAQRLALHLLRCEDKEVEKLGQVILGLKQTVGFCKSCGGITELEECAICTNPARNREMVCVVEEPRDLIILENTGQYKGLYHVLHGVLSPVDGVGPEDLNLRHFEERVRANNIKEVIVATNPTVEGDATALYIARALEPLGCSVTRLARGLPMGATLEFADDVTLARAIERREEL
ncbi:MAG: recombination mediator RecR [Candidatus Krumholzibacteria bacterium]|nr:recombination mediator RecR [Candidatus Krumholzibacteria bacterium]